MLPLHAYHLLFMKKCKQLLLLVCLGILSFNSFAQQQELLPVVYSVRAPFLPEPPLTAAQLQRLKTDSVLRINALNIIHPAAEYNTSTLLFDEQIADRLSCTQKQIPLVYNSTVRSFIDYFTGRRADFVEEVLTRQNVYFPLFEQILAEEGMPEELKYLSVIESGLDPRATSVVGAKGLWQFMPATGRDMGLKINNMVDERQDPVKSTRAACRYLRWLNKMFHGDWELAIAAYNCGAGNVLKAQRRSGKRYFWDIWPYLPRETRSYLPQYTAITYLMEYAQEHRINVNEPQWAIPATTVQIRQSLNLKKLATEINICYTDLKNMNPELLGYYTPVSSAGYSLQIPTARAIHFENNKETIIAACTIQQRYARSASPGVSANIASSKFYTVKSGDSLWKISKQFPSLSIAKLKQLNNIKNDVLLVGQRLRIE